MYSETVSCGTPQQGVSKAVGLYLSLLLQISELEIVLQSISLWQKLKSIDY